MHQNPTGTTKIQNLKSIDAGTFLGFAFTKGCIRCRNASDAALHPKNACAMQKILLFSKRSQCDGYGCRSKIEIGPAQRNKMVMMQADMK
jgi:hypothetical protein